MPRPRVRPEDRRRAANACEPCKSSKKRCDAKLPCSLCVKKGLACSCIYVPSQNSRPLRQPASAHPPSASSPPRLSRTRLEHGTQHYESDHVAPEIRNSISPTPEQRPVMLLSSSGEKVFVGNTAAISFLRFLQATLKHYVGPSGFADDQHSHNLFEAAAPEAGTDCFHDQLDDEEKKALIQCFLDASSGILDLYTADEIPGLLYLGRTNRTSEYGSTQGVDRTALAPLYLMLAIGAQCRGMPCAAEYFSQARKMAFERMLDDPTVNLVRTFLLMAFYMLGACRRNSAFMYIGVASKAADILGLDMPAHYERMTKAERYTRLRTATSLRAFDVICSSILGRHGSVRPLSPIDAYATHLSQESSGHRALALSATYELSSVLATVVDKMAEDGGVDATSAENFLKVLQDWSQNLPAELRQRLSMDNELDSGSSSREVMVGNIHTAGTYYFSIILVTRHFLIQHIMPQLRGHRTKQPETDNQAGIGKVAELSDVCVHAATFMAQMCYEAMENEIFLGNMCIIKAWIFAAGLVLGFSLLGDGEIRTESREAFHGSQRILWKLGRLSPQADQYYRILASFSETIDAYRRQLRCERSESKAPYVERILSLNTTNNAQAGQTVSPQLSLLAPDLSTTNGSIAAWQGADGMMSFSDIVPNTNQWPPFADDELMLRLLWDNATSLIDLVA